MTLTLIYGLKTCDTCRKALKTLKEAGIAAELVDLRDHGMPDDLLLPAFKAFGVALLNTRSTTWRALPEADRTGSVPDLLRAHPALMKRPLLRLPDGTLHLGLPDDLAR